MTLLAALTLFATMNEAALDGLKEAKACSANHHECGGVVYLRADGQFEHSGVVSGKAFGVDLSTVYEPVPTGTKVVADYHVHICSGANDKYAPFFSIADVLVNVGMHTVGYMFDFCTHNVHRFDPASDDRDDEEFDYKPHPDGTQHPPLFLTNGHVAGWLP